jgi:predicted transposase YdaD
MPKGYDAVAKSLVDLSPPDWLALTGRPPAPVRMMDSDNSVVMSGAVDKLLRVHADPEYLLHLDFQAGHDSAQLPRRLKLYNAVQEYKHGLPVLSVAVLLHPGADSPRVTGSIQSALPGESAPHSYLRYGVLRVWQAPVDPFLSGGLGLLPLAPISNVTEAEVPDVIRRMDQRLRQVREQDMVDDILNSTAMLMQLRYSEEFLAMLSDVIRGELEQTTLYRTLLRSAQLADWRKMLLLVGEKRFGPADVIVRAAVNAISQLQELERLCERAFDVDSWQELFTPPQAPPPA